MSDPLEKIITYKLSQDEADTYKLVLLWEKLVKKFIPSEQYKMTGSRQEYSGGDPRSTHLFKLCWKLRRETKGLIKPNDYKYYFYAQIDTLLKISNNNKHAYIDNSVIVGDRAWRRWKIWNHYFTRRLTTNRDLTPVNDCQTTEKLANIKRFLIKTFNRLPVVTDYTEENIKKWLDDGTITPVYVLLSPFVKNTVGDSYSHLGFDPKLYDRYLNGFIHDYFQKEFAHEFAQ